MKVKFIDKHPELKKTDDGTPLDYDEDGFRYLRSDVYESTFFINDHQEKLPCPVISYLVVDDKCLVFLDTDDDFCKSHDRARSIWCYDSSGKKFWEIEDAHWSVCRQKKKKYPYQIDKYAGMHQRDDGVVLVYTWGGFTGELDIETGLVSNWMWSK